MSIDSLITNLKFKIRVVGPVVTIDVICENNYISQVLFDDIISRLDTDKVVSLMLAGELKKN